MLLCSFMLNNIRQAPYLSMGYSDFNIFWKLEMNENGMDFGSRKNSDS